MSYEAAALRLTDRRQVKAGPAPGIGTVIRHTGGPRDTGPRISRNGLPRPSPCRARTKNAP
ncbi:hypothetical protein GCM10022403_031080 [Streptomyces coacervatus]|uniref:Uncharacterized protein n=1 Tax=Streptomyces coacervatus TaxID=647381 RepID=A0ABP7HLF5_9ACTN